MRILVIRLREKLRDRDNYPYMDTENRVPVGLAREAADEIERLLEEVKQYRGASRNPEDIRKLAEAAEEIERLRSGLQHADATTESLMEQLDDVCKERDEAVRLLSDRCLFIVPDMAWQDRRDAFLDSQEDKP